MSALTLITDTADTLDENLALDEALLLAAEAGESGEVLRLWEWPKYAVVLGASGSVAIDVNEEACRADGVSIHRRASGGGTVLLGRGCLLFSLVLSYERAAALRDVNASYRWILGKICHSLSPNCVVEFAGTSDLALAGRKFSGNAQQRKARFMMHHGSLLYDFDLERLRQYLKRPEREPAYREGREHSEFVVNLPASNEQLRTILAGAFEATPGILGENVLARVPGLVADRYTKADWVRRR